MVLASKHLIKFKFDFENMKSGGLVLNEYQNKHLASSQIKELFLVNLNCCIQIQKNTTSSTKTNKQNVVFVKTNTTF